MTRTEFHSWYTGYIKGINGKPSKKQLEYIQKKVDEFWEPEAAYYAVHKHLPGTFIGSDATVFGCYDE